LKLFSDNIYRNLNGNTLHVSSPFNLGGKAANDIVNVELVDGEDM